MKYINFPKTAKACVALVAALVFNLEAIGQAQITYDFDVSTVTYDNSGVKKRNGVNHYAAVPYKGYVDISIAITDAVDYDILINKKAVNYNYPEEEEKFLKSQDLFFSHIGGIESDEMIVTIQVTRKADSLKYPDVELLIKTFGRFKMDISTGAIFNIGLNDEEYFVKDDIIGKDKKKNDLSPIFPTALTHAYWKSDKQVSLGFSIGFGISEDTKTSYYFGPSLLIGDNQRLIFSTGAALRPVKELKSEYSVGETLTGEIPDAKDLTTSVNRIGGFFAITYNLTSKKE